MTNSVEPMPNPIRTIRALDGLRGIAVLLVIMFHVNVLFGGDFGTATSRVVPLIFGAGWTGVDLFFVLSGYLITSLLLRSKTELEFDRYMITFYARRALRILPLYYGFLTFYLLLPKTWVIGNEYHVSAMDAASFYLCFYNVYVAFWHTGIPVLHQFWSLVIEEQFYLVWPFIVWFLPVRHLRSLCIVLTIGPLVLRTLVILFASNYGIAYLFTPCRVDGLALGSLLAVCSLRPEVMLKLRRWLPMILTGALVTVIHAVARLADSFHEIRSDIGCRVRSQPVDDHKSVGVIVEVGGA